MSWTRVFFVSSSSTDSLTISQYSQGRDKFAYILPFPNSTTPLVGLQCVFVVVVVVPQLTLSLLKNVRWIDDIASTAKTCVHS